MKNKFKIASITIFNNKIAHYLVLTSLLSILLGNTGCAEPVSSIDGNGYLAIDTQDVNIVAILEEEQPIDLRSGRLPVTSINTDNGIRIESDQFPTYEKTEQEITDYLANYSIEETEAWLGKEIEEHFNFYASIVIVSDKPLELEYTIATMPLESYSDEVYSEE